MPGGRYGLENLPLAGADVAGTHAKLFPRPAGGWADNTDVSAASLPAVALMTIHQEHAGRWRLGG